MFGAQEVYRTTNYRIYEPLKYEPKKFTEPLKYELKIFVKV